MYNKEAVMAYNNLKMPTESKEKPKKTFSTGLLSRINYDKKEDKEETGSLNSVSKYVLNIRKARQDLKDNDRT
tara:strand:- start:255 stop:473 length:219 start_codon:yes stop_codon:yes gene_type:complete